MRELLAHVLGRVAGWTYGVAGALLDAHSRTNCPRCRRELERFLWEPGDVEVKR